MTRIAAVIVVVGSEPYEACLESLYNLDEIQVFVTETSVAREIDRLGLSATVVQRPPCIETIVPTLLRAATADWVLFIDPDERFVCGDLQTLREWLERADILELSGFSLRYLLSFMGRPLLGSYSDLRKPKLVRPSEVSWPREIHSLPLPASGKSFYNLPEAVASITSDLIEDVERRLIRHISWAKIESTSEQGSVGTQEITEALGATLREYFLERTSAVDGVAGVLNGLLHVQKTITRLLFNAEARGLDETDGDGVIKLISIIQRAIKTLEDGQNLR